MRWLFTKNFLKYIFIILFLSGGLWYFNEYYQKNNPSDTLTATVTLGTVRQTITISGKVEANQSARLGFPVGGTIQQIYKKEGDSVTAGEVIASLTSDALVAEYMTALQQIRYQEEIKNELVRGPLDTDRAVARSNVQVAEANLATVITDYDQSIKNARQALLTNDLKAYPTDPINNDIPPTISGNFLCETEGKYIVSIYNSQSDSGISYNLSGLESGTYVGNVDTPDPLGTCGLYIQFNSGEIYRTKEWAIEIPNRRSNTYIEQKNIYDLLVAKRASAIKASQETLSLAQSQEKMLLAPASSEVLGQAEANLSGAQATLAQQEAKIADYTIRAPFSGVVSNVKMKAGEPVSADHAVTIVYEGDYQLTAQIPEVDITKVEIGDQALVTFDAKPEIPFSATIDFIAPLSTTVGGVAYYEARFTLAEAPSWLREGLNSDVTIETEIIPDVPILPKRFINFTEKGAYVIIKSNAETEPYNQPITVDFIGTDGNVKVKELPIGTKVFLP